MVFLGLVRKLMLISVDCHALGSGMTTEVFNSLRFLSFGISFCGEVEEGSGVNVFFK